MKAAEIRSKFLKFFESRGHTIVESSPLVPQNDPTLLFTNAGMVQFKDAFLGKEKRSYVRATTSQKCVRAGGKHNDLENVGFTARHHTFFEMLGNFSFGDYFKKEAIRYAWEFVTQELKFPKDKVYVTVFEKDDEAAQIWHEQEGVPKDRIYRFGEKDNFWSMGDTGPCGPCSELLYDRGKEYSCGKTTCGPGCDCDRFLEFWNLVFMQFDRSASGEMKPLPRPSVDTGAGLERLAAIIQGADSNYDTDIFQSIITKIGKQAGQTYDRTKPQAVSFRVIADHARATTFLIADGVLPSNEGRGYVLRRIMRRAIRHGKKLGFTGPFLFKTIGYVIDEMKLAYPDLVEKQAWLEKAVQAEEEQFFKTLEKGLALLDEQKALLKGSVLPGEVAFKLYDTYGFPLDLTRVICEENKLTIDEAGFEKCMDRQRSESRKHWKGSGEQATDDAYHTMATELAGKLPVFLGYEQDSAKSRCIAALPVRGQGADAVVEAVFAETPFYAEGGGQVGDRGRVTSVKGDFEGEVLDVKKPVAGLIVVHIHPLKGQLSVGQEYLQETDQKLRALTAKNHTATHLLHWALRKTLGNHVKQAGSLVNPDLLRFDFSHFQAMTDAEVTQIEDLINDRIWHSDPVVSQEMDKAQAMNAGAIAFFGEKYGDRVRVVKVGDVSTELCGGTHVKQASDIHLFKIASESGIAAGVRRIIAYTSQGAFNYLRGRDVEVKIIRDRLKASSSDEILGKIDKMAASEREVRKQLEQAQAKNAGGEVDELLANAAALSSSAGSTRMVCAEIAKDPHSDSGVKRLRDLADRLKQKDPSVLVVLGTKESDEKVAVLVAVGPKAPQGLKANELLQNILGPIGGRGGGKPDLAQAGGTIPAGLTASLDGARDWVKKTLK